MRNVAKTVGFAVVVLVIAASGTALYMGERRLEPETPASTGLFEPPRQTIKTTSTKPVSETQKPRKLEDASITNPEPVAVPVTVPVTVTVSRTAAPNLPPEPTASPARHLRIAIVIDDAGVDRKRTARAIALPGPLTIAFLAYAGNVSSQVKAAKAAGHEILAHVAMEAESYEVDPGPNVLLRDTEPAVVLKRLDWVLGRFTGYVGVNNHMGSKFTSDAANMRVVLQELKRRGLFFLDSRTSPLSKGETIAREIGMPSASRNVFLDNEPEFEQVMRRLEETEQVAMRNGSAVAIGHPKDATLVALAKWLPAIAAKGFTLVPVSQLMHHPAVTFAEKGAVKSFP
ncbi:MAG: divergent polysaccharide deacetylase family protein [Rhodospirillales bacterium]|nr:divergent polysaccharide deacetylase family protein [Rhodospirillales bacterium]